MGCTCLEERDLKKQIENDIQGKKIKERNYIYKIEKLNYLSTNKKNDILKKVQEKSDFKITNEITEYYNILNLQSEINIEKDTIKNEINELDNLLNDINTGVEFDIINNNYNDLFNTKKKIKNFSEEYMKDMLKSNKGLKYLNNIDIQAKDNLNNFCDLNDIIINEIKGIETRKKNFSFSLFEENEDLPGNIYASIGNTLNYKLNDFENHIKDFEKNLNNYNIEIRAIIREILKNNIIIEKVNDKYNNLKQKIENTLEEQNNLEEKWLKEKNDLITNTINDYRKAQISSSIEDLNSLTNRLLQQKNIINNIIQEYKSFKELIIKKENTKYFISFQIKDQKEKLKFLRKHRNNINIRINLLNDQISIINNTVRSNSELSYISYIFYINKEKFNKKMNDINIQKRITKKHIEDIDEICEEDQEFIDMKKNIKKLIKDLDIIIKDNNSNKQIDIGDKTFLTFKNKEEKIIEQLFRDNRINIESILLNDDEFNYIPQISNILINKIYINEKFDDFCKNTIIKEIEIVSNDEDRFKIDYLTILLVGRKGIGKTSLIKYMLELSDDDISEDKKNFKEYKSRRVKYLRLIEVKGIGYDKDSTPENIRINIQEYINDNNNQNFKSVIHCIWYCFSGPRFEDEEKSLFRSLKEIYKDNTIPIILVFTKSTDENLAKEMRQNLINDNINNNFIEVMAKNMKLTDDSTKKAFGKEELMKTTLTKCKEAFKSDMMKIMIQQISNDITKKFLNKNEKIMEEIKKKTFNDFVEHYTEPLGDGDFFSYINNIFFKYLSNFIDNVKNISNKSRNIFFKSDLVLSIYKIYLSYKAYIKNSINSNVTEKAKELIDLQANMEKKFGNMEIKNRRNYDEFEKTIKIFLKKNYYFIIQNYIVNFILNSPNNYFNHFLSSIHDKIKSKFNSLGNLNNHNEDSNDIRKYLVHCFKKKLTYFSQKNNIDNDNEDIHEKQQENIIFAPKINFIENNSDKDLESNFRNSDSIIFKKINKTEKYFGPKIKIALKNHLEEINYNCLTEELNIKLKKFVLEVKDQNSLSNIIDDNDIVFNYFLQGIKSDLFGYIHDNLFKYFKELNYNYNLISNNNKFYDQNEIGTIIRKTSIKSFYEKCISNELINNYVHNFHQNSKKLKQITIILTGKSGVGKSSLINCLLKENVAKTGAYKVITMNTINYNVNTINFLNLIDTRGYELKKEYTPDIAKNNVLIEIENRTNTNNINDIIHFIYFCVNASSLDDSEIKALKELKNNIYNIPLLVVFTNAQKKDDVDSMSKQINNLFSDDIFVHVLGIPTKEIKNSFGLDTLLNKTLKIIKTKRKNNLFDQVKNYYKDEVNKIISDRIKDKPQQIINKITEEFINDYSYVKARDDFEEYIYKLIEKIFLLFSNDDKGNYELKNLIKNEKIKKYIQSCINIYHQLTQNYINEILDEQSLIFLDMQVCVENMKKASIKPKNKKNRNDFKDLITDFLYFHFNYLAQKYLIGKLIDRFEELGEIILQNVKKIVENILESEEIINDYGKIYHKMLEKFEEEKINKLRDDNHNIYSLKIINKI